MQLGASLPIPDIGTGPVVLRDYAQAAEGLGFDFLLAADHVLGNNPDVTVAQSARTGVSSEPRGGWTQSAPQRLSVPRDGMPVNSGQHDDCSFAASTPARVSILKPLRLSRACGFESHSLRHVPT